MSEHEWHAELVALAVRQGDGNRVAVAAVRASAEALRLDGWSPWAVVQVLL